MKNKKKIKIRQIIKNKPKNYFAIASGIALLAVFFYFVHFIDINFDYFADSDNASELILGYILSKENRFLTSSWYYSTELRVLNNQIFYMLFFKIFSNWHTVRIASYICLYIVMIASYFFFCKQYKCKEYFFITATLLMIPFSSLYFDLILKGTYYIPHVSITFATLGLGEAFVNAPTKKKSYMWIAIAIVLSVLAGMGGPRQLIILYIPLVLSSIGILATSLNEKSEGIKVDLSSEDKRYILFVLISFLSGVIGYKVNVDILSTKYYFRLYEGISFAGFDFSKLAQIINGFLLSYGYTSGNIFGKTLIYNLACMTWILLTIISCSYFLRNKSKVAPAYYRMALFVVSAFVIFFLLYLFTNHDYTDRYNLPIVILSIPMIAIFVNDIKATVLAKRVGCILLLLLMMYKGHSYCQQMETVDNTAELRQIVSVLQENDYTQGYSTFWRSNVLTELSNGSIDVWCWQDSTGESLVVTDINTTMRWLQLRAHDYTRPSGKVFMLFTAGEWENNMWAGKISTDTILYQSDGFIVIGYESYEKLWQDTMS